MEFKDFKDKPKELVGKYVLFTSGMTYDSRNARAKIAKITRVTKTSFAISGEDVLFSLSDGRRRGGYMVGFSAGCKLMTDEEAQTLRQVWAVKKATKALREELLPKFENLSYEDLVKFKETF
jgi:hypothetical protein